jgi:hypothetical protein
MHMYSEFPGSNQYLCSLSGLKYLITFFNFWNKAGPVVLLAFIIQSRCYHFRSYYFLITFNYLWGWSGTKSSIKAAIYCLLYQLWMTYGDDCGAITGENEWQGKPNYSEETCPSAPMSTIDPT